MGDDVEVRARRRICRPKYSTLQRYTYDDRQSTISGGSVSSRGCRRGGGGGARSSSPTVPRRAGGTGERLGAVGPSTGGGPAAAAAPLVPATAADGGAPDAVDAAVPLALVLLPVPLRAACRAAV